MPENTEEAASPTILQLTVRLSGESDTIGFPVTPEEDILEVKQTLGSLPATQTYNSYYLAYQGKKLADGVAIADIVSAGAETVELDMVDAPYTEKSAREHLIKVRQAAALERKLFYGSLYDFSGIAAGASTYADLALDPVRQPEEEEAKAEGLAESDETEATPESESNADAEAEAEAKDETAPQKVAPLTEDEKAALAEAADSLFTKPVPAEVAAKPTQHRAASLRALEVSGWSPASKTRKLAGDLFYLFVTTLEGETFHITAHTTGFFVNRSTSSHFDGRLRTLAATGNKGAKRVSSSHSLLTLLESLSPKFMQTLRANAEFYTTTPRETFDLPSNCLLADPWLVQDSEEPSHDGAIVQDNYIKGGLNGNDQSKDWNEEFQGLRELQAPDLEQRITREQLLNETSFGFETAAIQGAVEIVRGNIDPMNPEDDPEQYIFLRGGIFYSKTVDASGQFSKSGGSDAARSCALRDVAGVRCLNRLDATGVCHLLTAVVDYAGHRIVAQTLVPGVFNQDHDDPAELKPASIVVYGVSDEDGAKYLSEEATRKRFEPIGEALHLKPHKAWDAAGNVVDVVTSVQTKGLNGTDGRKYIVDLYRTTPIDIEFLDANKSYSNREATLRHEAVEEWWRRQVAVAIKAESDKIEKEGKKPEGEEKQTIGIDTTAYSLNPDAFSLPPAPTEELAKQQAIDEDQVREVSKFVPEVLIPEFVSELQNGRLFTPVDGKHLSAMLHKQGIPMRYLGFFVSLLEERKAKYLEEREEKKAQIAKDNVEEEEILQKQEAEVQERIQKRTKQIQEAQAKGEEPPEEEEAPKDEREYPDTVKTSEAAAILTAVSNVAVGEIVARATKHFLREQTHSLDLPLIPYVIAYVHNCLLSAKPEVPALEPLLAGVYSSNDIATLKLSPADVRAAIATEAKNRFRYELPADYSTSLRPVATVKRIAQLFGIQWQNRTYALTAEAIEKQIATPDAAEEESSAAVPSTEAHRKHGKKHNKQQNNNKASRANKSQKTVLKTTFSPADVLSLVPLVKDSVFESTTADQVWEAGKQRLASGETDEGVALLNEAMQIYERIYGSVHPETARASSSLADVCMSLKMPSQAVGLGRKSFQALERVTGIDSYESVLALSRLATEEISNKQYLDGLHLTKRVIDQWIIAYGEDHPAIVDSLSSIALLLHNFGVHEKSLELFAKSIELSEKVNGETSQATAMLRFQSAQALVAQQKLPEAAEQCEKAYNIFKEEVGLADVSTRETRKWVKGLKNYIEVSEQQEKYIKQVRAQQAKAAKKLEEQQKQEDALKRKKNPNHVAPNPEIAEKSVDEIMSYINAGSQPKKKGKKKHGKKH